ncbi:MAG: restriction endonuclease [Planctomycetes bacterium]|nr:restriction endonuclease [Planctomycetota bacterium]
MMPTQTEVELPLLQTLVDLGGEAKPKDVYPLLTAKFPQLTDEDLAEHLKHGEKKWHNRIQWARQALITAGDMCSPKHGIWGITDQGRRRVKEAGQPATAGTQPAKASITSLVDLYEKYDLQFRSKLLDKLHDLTPTQFEHFARQLLVAYGFVQVGVTQVSKDGGIDGHGMLKVGLARMAVAFQCKRWEGNVSRPEVDKFRGAIQGEYEQGIFFATSDFTRGATGASIKKGAVPIVLLNGDSIVDLMIEKEFGVQKKPLQVYEDQIDSIFGDDE